MATLRSYGAKVGNRGAARGPTISDHLGVGLFATGWGVGSKTVVGIFGGCGLRIDVFFLLVCFFLIEYKYVLQGFFPNSWGYLKKQV